MATDTGLLKNIGSFMKLEELKPVAVMIFLLLPVPAFLFSLSVGKYPISPAESLSVIISRLTGDWSYPDLFYTVIFDIRLPRILIAMLVGATLSVAGASFQGIFKNPLVDSHILGLSSGAAFGAALSLAVLPVIPVQLGAFIFSLAGLFLSYILARSKGETPVVSLVLSGVIISAVFGAMLSIIQYMVDEKALQSIVFWLMGSFNASTWSRLGQVWFLMVAGCIVIYLLRWRLNVMALGEEEARTTGMNVERYKAVFIIAAAVATSAAVSISGIIGLVGLIVPHIVRMIFGPDHRIVIPLSMTLGAAYMVMVDDLARSSFGFELPIGIITTLIGAPFFIYLLRATRAGSWE
jgi:iron complex transport system permease protein